MRSSITLLVTAALGVNVVVGAQKHAGKVFVQLGVMSRCPDARVCEDVFNQVLLEVGQLVDIELVYIANKTVSGPEIVSINCNHGPQECYGNMQQLCAKKYWADLDSKGVPTWWKFVQCQDTNGVVNKRSIIGNDPAGRKLAQDCATKVGKTWAGSQVDKCADPSSKEGLQLLLDSTDVAAKLNLKKSCSVVIENKLVCYRDGVWVGCKYGSEPADFVRLIKEWASQK